MGSRLETAIYIPAVMTPSITEKPPTAMTMALVSPDSRVGSSFTFRDQNCIFCMAMRPLA